MHDIDHERFINNTEFFLICHRKDDLHILAETGRIYLSVRVKIEQQFCPDHIAPRPVYCTVEKKCVKIICTVLFFLRSYERSFLIPFQHPSIGPHAGKIGMIVQKNSPFRHRTRKKIIVRIQERQILASNILKSRIDCTCRAQILLIYILKGKSLFSEPVHPGQYFIPACVRGTIINDNQLYIRIILLIYGPNAGINKLLSVIAWYDHTYFQKVPLFSLHFRLQT